MVPLLLALFYSFVDQPCLHNIRMMFLLIDTIFPNIVGLYWACISLNNFQAGWVHNYWLLKDEVIDAFSLHEVTDTPLVHALRNSRIYFFCLAKIENLSFLPVLPSRLFSEIVHLLSHLLRLCFPMSRKR